MAASHPVRLTCPSCQAQLYLQRDRIGQTVTCPDCLDEFVAAETVLVEPAGGLAPMVPVSESERPSEALSDPDRSDGELPPSSESGRDSGDTVGELAGALDDVDYEFDLECPLCGTRQDASRSQIGQKLRCPDCHFLITVREPPRRRRRKPGIAVPADEDLRLSAPEEPLRQHALAREILDTAAREVPRENARRVAPDAVVQDALRRAKSELDAEESARPRLPRRPLTTGLVGFLFELRALIRCLGLGLGLAVEVAAIVKAVQLFHGGPFEQFLCVLLSAFCVVFGTFLVLIGAMTLLAVLQDTAIGKDVIENGPEGFIVDWLPDSAYVLVALFTAVLPGVLLGQAFLFAGGISTIYTGGIAVCCGVSAFVLFPVLLLSSLETGNPLLIYSRRIARSLGLLLPAWLVFYLLASGLVALTVLVLQLYRFDSFLVHTIAMTGVAALVMIYFRLLGRLAWCCREAIAEIETEEAAVSGSEQAGAG